MKDSMIEILSVAGVIGLAVVGVALAMAFLGRDVPDWLSMSVGAVVGYFYGKLRGGNDKPPNP